MTTPNKWRIRSLVLTSIIPTLILAQWSSIDPGFNASRGITVQDHKIFVASYLSGIKMSDDNGQTWVDRNIGSPSTGGHIYAESIGSDGNWLFVGTHNGIFHSNDHGATWRDATGSIAVRSDNYPNKFFSFGNVTLAIMSTDPINGGGMFRTDDHGSTWNMGYSGMTGCGTIFNVMMSEGDLYASATGGLYISTDLGLNWNRISSFNFLFDYSISQNDVQNQVAAGKFGLSYSTDGGNTWQTSSGPNGYRSVDLELFDGRFLATVQGNDQGVWTSIDGASWSKMSGIVPDDELGLENSFVYGRVIYLGGLLNIYALNGAGVSIAPRVFLGAAFDNNSGIMRDDLRDLDLIPLEEPYSSLGFPQNGSGGDETTWKQVMTTTNSNAIVDWVLIELRDKNNSRTILETQSALVQRDGDVVSTTGHGPVIFNVPDDEYFISIRHRDHLGVMTKRALALSALPHPVDFTSGRTPTYGGNARMYSNGEWMLWPGNVQNDGVLRFAGENNDRDAILEKLGSTSSSATLIGYHEEDINMDGVVSYDGPNNDRAALQSIIGNIPTRVLLEQLP